MAPRLLKYPKKDNKRLYEILGGMKKRCFNPNCYQYKNYGGRGITVCEQWLDFDNFAEWAYSHGYADDLTIERIDVNGDYCPENCTWITLEAQARNRRSSLYLTYKGKTQTMVEWCEELGLEYKVVQFRIATGWSVERAFTEEKQSSTRQWKPVIQCDKQGREIKCFQTLGDASRAMGISKTAITRACNGIVQTSCGYKWKWA